MHPPCRAARLSLVEPSDFGTGAQFVSHRTKAPWRAADGAFTLIELTVVILIIILLAAALLTASYGMIERARKVQAKNDLTQIITAVNAYYTEYGKYPMADNRQGSDTLYGNPGGTYGNEDVINVLRSVNAGVNASYALNPRQIVFLNVSNAKSLTSPREGIARQAVTSPNGGTVNIGAFADPWGNSYMIEMDGNYDGYTQDSIPYSDVNYSTVNGQGNLVQSGCFSLSWGPDGKQGKNGNAKYLGSDDVLSWQ